MVSILRDVFGDQIIYSDSTLINKMHDARERGCDFSERRDIKQAFIGEGYGSIGNVLVGEVSERFGVEIMGSVGDSQDASLKGTIELVIVDCVIDEFPIVL
jgi:hypothetical protein